MSDTASQIHAFTLPVEFEVAGLHYRLRRLPVVQASELARLVLPVFTSIASGFDLARIAAARDSGTTDIGGLAAAGGFDIARIIQPFANALADMPQDRYNRVLAGCMSTVERQEGQAWVKIWVGGTLQFQDIRMTQMIEILLKVLNENEVGGFLSALGSILPGPSSAPASSSPPSQTTG